MDVLIKRGGGVMSGGVCNKLELSEMTRVQDSAGQLALHVRTVRNIQKVFCGAKSH